MCLCVYIYIYNHKYIYICIYQCISLFAYVSCHAFVSTQICMYMPVRFLWVCVCVSIRAYGIRYSASSLNKHSCKTIWTVQPKMGGQVGLSLDGLDGLRTMIPKLLLRLPIPTGTQHQPRPFLFITNRISAQWRIDIKNGHGWHSWHSPLRFLFKLHFNAICDGDRRAVQPKHPRRSFPISSSEMFSQLARRNGLCSNSWPSKRRKMRRKMHRNMLRRFSSTI